MASTVRLSVEAKFGHSGQYIARITGRAPKVNFARDFVGSKFGKRSESTSYETDETGLYEECDVTKQGKEKSYALVLPWKGELRKVYASSTDALAIAKRFDDGESLESFVTIVHGEPATVSEGYNKCNLCDRELPSGELCPEHPEARPAYSYRQVPKLSESGEPLYKLTYEIHSKAKAKATQAATSIDAALEIILKALQALPEPLQRKALTTAKARLFPKASE